MQNESLIGVLCTDIVFMGGTVARPAAAFVEARLDASDAMLVLGSSLQTYSAFRLVRL
jgi:NAD-dependent SIR2 family protein deacetylase